MKINARPKSQFNVKKMDSETQNKSKPVHFQKKPDKNVSVTRWIRTLFGKDYQEHGILNIYAANRGIALHKEIEYYLKKKPSPTQHSPEFQQFLDFSKDKAPHMSPYWIETHIESEYLSMSGIVDAVYIDDNEHFWLYDWKRSKTIEYEQEDIWDIGRVYSISQLQYSLWNAYVLQLNLYRIILESEYDMKLKGMNIVLFHPSNVKYKQIEIPRLPFDIEQEIIDKRLDEIR